MTHLIDLNLRDEFGRNMFLVDERPRCNFCGSLKVVKTSVADGDSDNNPAVRCLECKALEIL